MVYYYLAFGYFSECFCFLAVVFKPYVLEMPWMHIKLLFVFFLYVYHAICHKIFKQLQNDEVKYSSNSLRIWNEVATIILFAVVFLVVLKSTTNWIGGVIGLVLFSMLLMFFIRVYKIIRESRK